MSKISEGITKAVEKVSPLNACVIWGENVAKSVFFHCQHCGQCVLGHNSFICCMRCPKQLRNGPCGGTRANGHCEVYPERKCIWWWIFQRSKKLGTTWKMRKYHIPVDRRFQNTSSWLNMFAGRILPISFKFGRPQSDIDDENQQRAARLAKRRETASS